MNRDKIKKFFTLPIKAKNLPEFQLETLKINLSRGKLIAAVTLMIEVVIIIAVFLTDVHFSGSRDKYYHIMYMIFVIVMSFFLIAIIKLEDNVEYSRKNMLFTYAFIYFSLAWNMVISLLDGALTTYLVALLAISVIAVIRPIPLMIIFGSIQIAYCIFIPASISDGGLAFAAYVNSCVVTVIAWVAGYIRYRNQVTSFCYKKELEEKSALLERANRELNEANQKLDYLSKTDGLTGIYNRRMFDEVAHKFWRASLELDISLSVIMIDIDHFKCYNDTYGHLSGDDCLKRIVADIQKMIPEGSVLARYGGEEFTVLIHNETTEGTVELAERIRKSVAALRIEHINSEVKPYVTLSLGVYCGKPEASSAMEGFVERADRALYKAKNSGRNIVVVG